MDYKDAWEIIQFKHCEDTCDFGQMEDCQGDKCEYYLALKALNAQYYAEGNMWRKPRAEQTEPHTERSSE